jgi:hypothetical protein
MYLTPVQIQLLHVLFCFAQADREADARLVARLMLLSQRSLAVEVRLLQRRGWVDADALRLTPSGLTRAGRLRTGTDPRGWSEAA